MGEDIVFDLCVVGAGTFGSAAARHASANPTFNVCLVGPNEPADSQKSERQIFASHYDEGRITRVVAGNSVKQILSRLSMDRFHELEKLSGIKFNKSVGFLIIGEEKGKYIQAKIQQANNGNQPLVKLSKNCILKQRFPFLSIEENECCLFEDTGSGYISLRNMVRAQKKVAQEQGCTIIDEVVDRITEFENGFHKIITENSKIIRAKRVLIATGAFTDMKNFELLKTLKLERTGETVALLQISKEEAQRLSSMPSIVFSGKRGVNDTSSYILPPILYPDGKYYTKIGQSHSASGSAEKGRELSSLKELSDWFLSDGDQMITEIYVPFLTKLLDLKFSSVHTKTCAICYTATGLPYIDRVKPTVTVAVGGNGDAAKFGDEVGRIAAALATTGQWISTTPKAQFEAIFQSE